MDWCVCVNILEMAAANKGKAIVLKEVIYGPLPDERLFVI
jgi:hypothetical protein